MSFNQSKSDKSEAVYRKSGRSASFKQHRSFNKKSNSFNKKSNNAQCGHSRVNPTPVNSTEANSAVFNHTIQNDTHVQPQLHGEPDASLTTKPSESYAAQRSSRVVPKALTSKPMPPMSFDSATPTTPAKGDVSKAFPFQFGSISPDFMNGVIGMALHHDSSRSVPSGPTPPVLSRSNSLKAKPWKKGQLQHQVSVKSPTEANVSSRAVDSGISDTGVSEPAGTETNNSVAVNAEVLPSSLDTISAISCSILSAVEVKTNCSTDVSACVSAEGYDVQEFKQTEQVAAMVSTELIALKTLQKQKDEFARCSAGYDREDPQSADLPETTSIHIKDSSENVSSDSMSLPVSGNKDRQTSEANKVKTSYKGKKKGKEIFQKVDAARSTSDLYNAYKGPEEEKESVLSSESTENYSTSGSLEQLPADTAELGAIASEKCGESKAEPEDWEDVADMSTQQLEVADKSNQVIDESGGTAKKYSRDFRLKFSEQCTDLPESSEISADIADALMNANISTAHVNECDSNPSPGRIVDRPEGMSRMDRRGNGMIEEDRWNKVYGAFHSGRGLDGIGVNAGFRASQGGNFGVLRNPRAETPLQYAGVVLSRPMQSMGSQGGILRNRSNGERWLHSSSFQQRCLTPSTTTPQTPLQMMHKAEKKYEVDKILDAEQAKQWQLKAILKKLTPQNFGRLFEQVKAINIDNAVTLTGVISQIFEKALIEPTFCEMYANLCLHLASELPDFSEDNEKITFKRLLLNKCQEEFERGEREEEAHKADEGEVQQFDEVWEERRVKARRRMLGNIRLIGELYKKRMLTERIMHECIKKLLGQYQDPDEEDIEALCILMSTIGEMIDHPKAKIHIDAYFERMMVLSNNMNLSSRVRFMLKDVIDLRKNKWQQSWKVEGSKKIEELHRDALQERQAQGQAQAGRMGRGLGNNPSARRNPVDFGPRGSSMLSSPTVQMGGLRGYGSQDARFEERQSDEARNLSVPLPQLILGDDSITLGPRGGLARGMSIRGSTIIPSSSIFDRFPVPGDSHRMTTGLNGYRNLPERSPYGSREAIDKQVVQRVHQYIARFWYQAGLPFNLVKLDSFREMLDAIGKFGPHLPPPSYHAIRVPLLDMEVKYTEDLMKDHKVQQERFGCSIMSDAWNDRKQRTIINFLVNSTAGTMFIKSVDGSDFVKTGEKIFELLDAVVEEIGEGNVMQVITDNGSNYVLAGKMLESKRPKIYWTPCAAHCIDLMLKDIGKLPRIKMTIKRAISLVGFIYGHSITLSLMRHFTKKRELVKHAVTRFATSFLSLERLYEEKGNLRKMFVSDEWTTNKLSKEVKGREVAKIVLMPSFWKNVTYTMKVMGPLVKVLRLVDSEKKAAMGYIYEAMNKAKEAIMKAFNEKKNKYNDVFKIIDDRWTCQLHHPLHAAGHMLNPEYYYANQSMEFDPEVIGGMHACLHKFAPDTHIEFMMLKEMQVYKDATGMFGSSTAIAMRTEMAPAVWWRTFGSSAPNLQKIAIRILSLACSASGCERNWSVFEHIHTKKRNKLDFKRMHDLLYVKYNQALKQRYNIKDEVDPISLNEIDECNEWLVGEMDSDDDEGGNGRVFEEDDDLQCDVVYRASGIGEPRMNTRLQKTKNPVLIMSRGNKKPKSSASSSKRGKEKVVEEVDEEMEFDESELEVEAIDCDESDEEEIEGYVVEYVAEEDAVEDEDEDDIAHLIL